MKVSRQSRGFQFGAGRLGPGEKSWLRREQVSTPDRHHTLRRDLGLRNTYDVIRERHERLFPSVRCPLRGPKATDHHHRRGRQDEHETDGRVLQSAG